MDLQLEKKNAPHCYLTYNTSGTTAAYDLFFVIQIEDGWQYDRHESEWGIDAEPTPCSCGGGVYETYQRVKIFLKDQSTKGNHTFYNKEEGLMPGVNHDDSCHTKIIAQIIYEPNGGNPTEEPRKTIIRTIDADANGG